MGGKAQHIYDIDRKLLFASNQLSVLGCEDRITKGETKNGNSSNMETSCIDGN
jgi:hypothetical protein